MAMQQQANQQEDTRHGHLLCFLHHNRPRSESSVLSDAERRSVRVRYLSSELERRVLRGFSAIRGYLEPRSSLGCLGEHSQRGENCMTPMKGVCKVIDATEGKRISSRRTLLEDPSGRTF